LIALLICNSMLHHLFRSSGPETALTATAKAFRCSPLQRVLG
jgi:hypothetical protein